MSAGVVSKRDKVSIWDVVLGEFDCFVMAHPERPGWCRGQRLTWTSDLKDIAGYRDPDLFRDAVNRLGALGVTVRPGILRIQPLELGGGPDNGKWVLKIKFADVDTRRAGGQPVDRKPKESDLGSAATTIECVTAENFMRIASGMLDAARKKCRKDMKCVVRFGTYKVGLAISLEDTEPQRYHLVISPEVGRDIPPGDFQEYTDVIGRLFFGADGHRGPPKNGELDCHFYYDLTPLED